MDIYIEKDQFIFPNLTSYIQINFRWITDLNEKAIIIKY